MARYMINIAVGPVQGFIASARKLRDLWYGSYLLSELSKSVAWSLQDQKCTLIFPTVEQGTDALKENSVLNVANKILALTPDGAEPEQIAAGAEQAFKERWRRISRQALKKAEKILSGNIDKEMFAQQVDDFSEFYAAWVVYDPDDYPGGRARCEKLLAGRKLLRDFTAPTWDGTGKPKSSLDGINESVFSQQSAASYLVKKGEELDALGIIKRFGPVAGNKKQRKQFDSLPQVAAQPYLKGLAKASLQSKTVADIIECLPKVAELYPDKDDRPPKIKTTWQDWPEGLSTEILFPSVVKVEIRLREDDRPQKEIWENLEKELQELWKKTAEPLPYCCLLVGDGDNMGDTINVLKTVDQHQEFSIQLNAFAENVHSLLEKYQGRVVYSGGDDVLAYVPLHTALECADALNKAFAGTMEEACRQTEINKLPTFSMGMVIVHLHKPLHQALELARKAEQISKEQPGKNSLTIIQSKRGGTDIVVTGKWRESGSLESLHRQLIKFRDHYREGKLPSRLGYQLRAAAKECGAYMAWDQQQPQNVCAAEALRLAGRKQQKTGENLSPDEAASLLAGHTDLRQLSDRLIISHLISRAVALAEADWLTDTKGGTP